VTWKPWAMKRDVLRKRLWPKGQRLCSTIIMPNVEVVKSVLLKTEPIIDSNMLTLTPVFHVQNFYVQRESKNICKGHRFQQLPFGCPRSFLHKWTIPLITGCSLKLRSVRCWLIWSLETRTESNKLTTSEIKCRATFYRAQNGANIWMIGTSRLHPQPT